MSNTTYVAINKNQLNELTDQELGFRIREAALQDRNVEMQKINDRDVVVSQVDLQDIIERAITTIEESYDPEALGCQLKGLSQALIEAGLMELEEDPYRAVDF